MKKAKILVVEDESDIRQLMQMHLSREGYEVTVAEDGERGLRYLEDVQFDLAVLDWMLPGLSGLDLARRFSGKVPILMVTARTEAADIVLGLEMGADDFVTKPFEIPVFLARVRALLRRTIGVDTKSSASDTLELGDLKIAREQHRAWISNEEIKLTLSEFRLLTALVENRGRVLSRDRLIGLVQGEDVNVTDRTIDTHVFGLRKKLGSFSEWVETIRGVGYRVRAE